MVLEFSQFQPQLDFKVIIYNLCLAGLRILITTDSSTNLHQLQKHNFILGKMQFLSPGIFLIFHSQLISSCHDRPHCNFSQDAVLVPRLSQSFPTDPGSSPIFCTYTSARLNMTSQSWVTISTCRDCTHPPS